VMARVALGKITGPPGPARIDLPVSGPRAPPIALTGVQASTVRSAAANLSPGTVGQNTLTRNRNNRRTSGLSGRSLPGLGHSMHELACPPPHDGPPDSGRADGRPAARVSGRVGGRVGGVRQSSGVRM